MTPTEAGVKSIIKEEPREEDAVGGMEVTRETRYLSSEQIERLL